MTVKIWPSGIGATVKSGRLIFDVWDHGGVTRLDPDHSLCGFSGTHFATVPRGTFDEMAKAAVALWRNNRSAWEECC